MSKDNLLRALMELCDKTDCMNVGDCIVKNYITLHKGISGREIFYYQQKNVAIYVDTLAELTLAEKVREGIVGGI